MPEGMLGKLSLPDVQGPRDDLERKWAGNDGPLWLEAIKWLLKQDPRQLKIQNLKPNPPKIGRFWKKAGPNAIRVNLKAAPSLPFDGATIAHHEGKGWALVEKRGGGLYINRRKFSLYRSERQVNGRTLKGYELRDELTDKPVFNATLADALYENPHLLPEELKTDGNGNILFIYFFGTRFSDRDGSSGSAVCSSTLARGVGTTAGSAASSARLSPLLFSQVLRFGLLEPLVLGLSLGAQARRGIVFIKLILLQ
ncbi:MAG: hypothetical protein A3C01_02205 [Candidatus Yanofskybacteria bacterium RIFCSPHIGHO2_02_FULL_44_36b]|uniref:Uncharacterized protein n=1 Tax=Candidatus Yanofskybacteria bacterium GW2011_GWB1_45_11 TaxID=1619026 RepID=A0A0G1NA68_9BACT|nr:MAG: hypothetical protein UW90_C0009G0016 [Candidatus Yanofskybacteria bacterium GW2011_GWB1_45_11]OGN14725.1 MAG: hypothetical protein A3C01_02205 [Candidatus Yanofskybacteria bacterium RIFCSPHIGHO2_02_FULL_44_36b]OGN26945.1 MAG: hypothetical protein A3B12_00010 [Candidatus Yanofskybacteria bacterium RIFCSPLOWO2_01_FULL_44_88]